MTAMAHRIHDSTHAACAWIASGRVVTVVVGGDVIDQTVCLRVLLSGSSLI